MKITNIFKFLIFLLAFSSVSNCSKKTNIEENPRKVENTVHSMLIGDYTEQFYRDHKQKIEEKNGKLFLSFYDPTKSSYVNSMELQPVDKNDYNKIFKSNTPNILDAYKVNNGFFIVTPKETIFVTSWGKTLLKDGYALVTDISIPLTKTN